MNEVFRPTQTNPLRGNKSGDNGWVQWSDSRCFQLSLHINGIQEVSKLETDVVKHPHLNEASPLMQPNGSVVGRVSDHGDHLPIAQGSTLRL